MKGKMGAKSPMPARRAPSPGFAGPSPAIDPDRTFRIDLGPGNNPLMLIWPGRISSQGLANLRASFEATFRGDNRGEPRFFVIEGDAKVFQFEDGRWQALNP